MKKIKSGLKIIFVAILLITLFSGSSANATVEKNKKSNIVVPYSWPTTPTTLDFSTTVTSTSDYTISSNSLTFHASADGKSFEIKNITSAMNIESDSGSYELYLILEDVNPSTGELILKNDKSFVNVGMGTNQMNAIKLDNTDLILSGNGALTIIDGGTTSKGIVGNNSSLNIQEVLLTIETDEAAINLSGNKTLAITDQANVNVNYRTTIASSYGVGTDQGDILVSNASLKVTAYSSVSSFSPGISLISSGYLAAGATHYSTFTVENGGVVEVSGDNRIARGISSGKEIVVDGMGSSMQAFTFQNEGIGARDIIHVKNGGSVKVEAYLSSTTGSTYHNGWGVLTTNKILVEGSGSLIEATGGAFGIRGSNNITIKDDAIVRAKSHSSGAFSQSHVAVQSLNTNQDSLTIENGGKLYADGGTSGILCGNGIEIKGASSEVHVGDSIVPSQFGLFAGGGLATTKPTILIEDNALVQVQGESTGLRTNDADIIVRTNAKVEAYGQEYGVYNKDEEILASSGGYIKGTSDKSYGIFANSKSIIADNGTIHGIVPTLGFFNGLFNAASSSVFANQSYGSTSIEISAKNGGEIIEEYSDPVNFNDVTPINPYILGKNISQLNSYNWANDVMLDSTMSGLLATRNHTTPQEVSGTRVGNSTGEIVTLDASSKHKIVFSAASLSTAPNSFTVLAGANGSVNSSINGTYHAGDIIGVVATPAPGYVFDRWTSNAGGTIANASDPSTTFTMPNNAVTLRATFRLPSGVNRTIKATSGMNGKISPSGIISVADGNGKSFTFKPNKGFVVDKVLVNNSVVSISKNVYHFTNVRSNQTIHVTFKQAEKGNPTVSKEKPDLPISGNESIVSYIIVFSICVSLGTLLVTKYRYDRKIK